MMHRFTTFPILLLHLPFEVCLSLILLTFSLCQGIYLLAFPSTQNAAIVVIPVLLTAWLFRYRGMILCALLTAITVETIRTFLFHIVFWSLSSRILALTGLAGLMGAGCIVAHMRSIIDMIEIAQCKSLQAEQQLQIAYEQQRQLLEQKDSFLTHVNHELRSPLTTVYGSLQVLKQAIDIEHPLLEAFHITCLNRALQSCETLIHQVNQALEVASLHHDVPVHHSEPISIHQVVRELLEHGDPRIAQTCRLHLNLSEQVMVRADRQFLSQVLWNVLSNVCTYCPPQTSVTISATPSAQANIAPASICIRVQDSGPGIPPEEIPHLFSPFVRLKRDLAMSLPGSGLGLYISKRLVEAMGGQIWVESSGKSGEGSCFCLTLPMT